jgi:hypothetical protein
MSRLKVPLAAVVLCSLSAMAIAQLPPSPNDVLDKVIAQEQFEVQLLRQYSPLVETYIQYLRPDKQFGAVPNGDKYFLGRASLSSGVELEPLEHDKTLKRKLSEDWREFLSIGFVPGGFLQMVFVDTSGFDRQHYHFEYVRREFLGEVRCLVFDVSPLQTNDKGRFVGRIWVEDRNYHIVRFNGSYGESFVLSHYFNFDSWRTNVAPNLWLPSFVYTEQGNLHDPQTARLAFLPFRAQTRIWGYNLAYANSQQELTKVLIEGTAPVRDLSAPANDPSPVEAERAWNRQAESNVTEYLERHGLLAPAGEVDKVLETVVNNLELTNDLEIQPEVHCRVLMISTLESFTIGHTIVLSRGLVDVLPDEASLAAILAHELSHVVLGQGMDTEYAFFNSLHFNEKNTFRRFEFARTPGEEKAAQQKAYELLKKSPYQEKAGAAQLFLEAVKNRSKDIPNLLTPSLGDRVPTDWTISGEPSFAKNSGAQPAADTVAALPLGARIKVDPWTDQLQMAKSRPGSVVAEAERMPFQVTPLFPYLTRQDDKSAAQAPGSVGAKLETDAKPD